MTTRTVETGICRFDLEDRGIHGYMARIMRRGESHQHFFSDSVHGGKRKALKAAREKREELLESLPAPKPLRGRLTKRNSTGIVGVHLTQDTDRRNKGYEYSYRSYVASWLDEDGKRINVRFSWNKYGEETALELAKIARKRELRDRDQIVKIYERSVAAKKRRKKASRAKAQPRSTRKKAVKTKSPTRKTSAKKKSVAKKKVVKKAAKKKKSRKK